jgi:hypothetical protein
MHSLSLSPLYFYLPLLPSSSQRAAKYVEDLVPSLRKTIQKAEMPAKAKKGNAAPVRVFCMGDEGVCVRGCV